MSDAGTLVTVRTTERSVRVDVTNAGARAAKAYGMAQQASLARNIAGLFGLDVDEKKQPIHQSKRGLANRGFSVVLWKKGA